MIAQALADLDARGIGGRDATPYLLGRIVELTDGRSLTANIALVRENARVGAEIAVQVRRARLGHLSGRPRTPDLLHLVWIPPDRARLIAWAKW